MNPTPESRPETTTRKVLFHVVLRDAHGLAVRQIPAIPSLAQGIELAGVALTPPRVALLPEDFPVAAEIWWEMSILARITRVSSLHQSPVMRVAFDT